MRRLAAEYASDDDRYFFPGSSGPKCSVDGWYDKVQQSRENYTQLYWDGQSKPCPSPTCFYWIL